MRTKTIRDCPATMIVMPTGIPVLLVKSDPVKWDAVLRGGYLFSMIVDQGDVFMLQFLAMPEPASIDKAFCFAETAVIQNQWRGILAVLLECRRPVDLFVGETPEDLTWFALCHDNSSPPGSEIPSSDELRLSMWYGPFLQDVRNILGSFEPKAQMDAFGEEFDQFNRTPKSSA